MMAAAKEVRFKVVGGDRDLVTDRLERALTWRRRHGGTISIIHVAHEAVTDSDLRDES